MEIKTVQKAKNFLLIGLFGGVLTLIGDLLIGYVKFPDGAGMLESYFAAALVLPVWRPILGGMIGFLGISLEFLGLMTVYPLLKKNMPRGAAFYKLSMYVYLAVAGGAVHLPCGVFMWLYHTAAEAAGQAVAYELAFQYILYFLLPVSMVFYVFFAGSSIVQFVGIVKGHTPLPKWYAVFNLLIVSAAFNVFRLAGNHALVNGLATSNKSIGVILLFAALYIGYGKYVTQKDLV